VANWRELFPIPIRDQEDAARFVDATGFCTWGPVPGFSLPNLAEAMGETATSVLDCTWYWKDDLHLDRRVFYAKVIRGQPTFIAPSFVPTFISALAGPGREAERDVVSLYLEGRLSCEARGIDEYLLDNPEEPTRNVRRE